MWIVTGASLIGTVANVYKKTWCFWVWIPTNVLWVIYDIWIGADAQGALMATYVVLAILGWCEWRKGEEEC